MNVSLNLDDAGWRLWVAQLRNALAGTDTMLKKAFLYVWPREAAKHFDEEMGPDGRWAPWKNSTRQARIIHELRAVAGMASKPGRMTSAQRARAEKKIRSKQAQMYASGKVVGRGGKLLQKSGRLRTETVQNPEFVELPGGLKVLSPTPYSGYLDEGTSLMEARPFMWLGDDAQQTMADILVQQIWDRSGGTD